MMNRSSQVDVGRKTIGDYINDAYSLKLDIIGSELECYASIVVHDLDNSISPAELISILKNHQISDTINLENIAIFCTEAAQGDNPENILVAAGTPPTHGQDGWFELLVQTGPQHCALEEDEKGRIIDFKNVQSFSNVTFHQTIGVIHPPTPGSDGKTVSGKAIPAVHGKPSPVTPGNGAELNEDGSQIVATREGRVILERTSINVVEELLISSDIDMSIGHISFNGFVSISGDVLDDFNVTAKKGININGAVGKCQISSDGPVSIGTMAGKGTGKGTGKVTCKGGFTARYLNQATIECLGDVIILQEARNSIVKATGTINASQGVITGGETIALEGIEAKVLGNVTGVRTHLTSGVYFPETDHLNNLRIRQRKTTEQLEKIDHTLKEITQKPVRTNRKSLIEAINLRIEVLTQRLDKLKTEKNEVEQELASFKASDHSTANPKISALKIIQEGVVISLGETTEELKHEVNGPVSVIENNKDHGLRFITYSPLNHSASEENEDEDLKAQIAS